MALADPQSLTIGTAQTMARIQTGPTWAVYQSADGVFTLRVDQSVSKNKIRRTILTLSRKKISTDPISDLKNEVYSTLGVTLVRPTNGFTEAELLELGGLFAWLTGSTNAFFKRVIAMES